MPSKIAVLKIAAFHCSFGVISSTNMVDSSEKCTRHDLEGQISKCSDVFLLLHAQSIPGVPEKAERWIFSTLRAESVAYFYIIR